MLHNAWFTRLRALDQMGNLVGPRGQLTREFLNPSPLVVEASFNLLDVPARFLNFRFAVAEWLWVAFGHSDVTTIAQYNRVMEQFSDDGVFLTGAYGPHVGAGKRSVLAKLRADRESRQAVIQIPRPAVATKDEPCTLSLQYLIRPNDRDGLPQLNCIVTMRSSDIWLGVPYDVFTFTQLQNCFAGELGVRRGWLALHAGSAHLYERDRERACTVLASDPLTCGTLFSPALPGFPPTWLDDVLRTRDRSYVPSPANPEDEFWHLYAEVLLSKSSADARQILATLGR